jgi:phosphoglucosamine mutase
MGLELKLRDLGIPFVRTQVGDRYVLSALKEHNWKIGGETSGHIVCLDKTSTGDGIIASLQVLSHMIHEQKSLDELMQDIILFPQVLCNLQTTHSIELMNHPQFAKEMAKHQEQLLNRGRVLIRPSGTEPLLRVLLEGEDEGDLNIRKQQIEQVVSTIAI